MRLEMGDCREVLRGIPAASIETCITDPPYGLGFMGKEWDKKKAKMRWVSERLREGVGLYDFTVEWASEVLRVLKPGGMLLSFGGTRTFHRIACGIEDAGFELRDMLMWMHGQGFPKGGNVSKEIDRLKGAKREKIGEREWTQGGGSSLELRRGEARTVVQDITAPATPEAILWNGWHANLKPAWEPIILAMKPLDGGYARNALAHGVAGLNVDGGRIGTTQADIANMQGRSGGHTSYGPEDTNSAFGKGLGRRIGDIWKPASSGRWPANVLLSHDPRCVCVGSAEAGPDRPPKDAHQPTEHDAPAKFGYSEKRHQFDYGREQVEVYACVSGCPVRILDEQSGEASRFFFYTAKASTSERERGLLGHIPCKVCGKLSSRTHRVKVRGELTDVPCRRNNHPTVKPLSLMQYLCRLTRTPTGGTVLDPFMGSGTTGIVCRKEHRDFIGIEQDPDAFEVAKCRIAAADRGTVKRVRGRQK